MLAGGLGHAVTWLRRHREVLEPAPERIAVEEVDDYLRRPLLTNWEKLIEDSSFTKREREDVEAVVMASTRRDRSPRSATLSRSAGRPIPQSWTTPE
jgi:hypothetical protein